MKDDIKPEDVIGKWICFRYMDQGPSYTDICKIIEVIHNKVYLDDGQELKRNKLYVRGVLDDSWPIN